MPKNEEYRAKWGTPVGKDCVDLCSTLPRWLGERLTHLGQHTNNAPYQYGQCDNTADSLLAWRADLCRHGAALTHLVTPSDRMPGQIYNATAKRNTADAAMRWVAQWYHGLWD